MSFYYTYYNVYYFIYIKQIIIKLSPCTQGLLTITLGFSRPASFTYKITHNDEAAAGARVEKLDGRNVSRYVLQEMTNNRLTYYFRAPRPGVYNMTIFAREVHDSEQPNANMLFKTVCDFDIVSDAAADAELKPFPYCSDSGWGLDTYVSRYPMVPENRCGILVCPEGRGQVSFVKNEPRLRVYARLVFEGNLFVVILWSKFYRALEILFYTCLQ